MSAVDRDSYPNDSSSKTSRNERRQGLAFTPQPRARKQSWTSQQGLSYASPQDEDFPLEPPPSLMRQANHSVPHLPSERPPQYDEAVDPPPSNPQYDPTSVLDQFTALRVNDSSPLTSDSASTRSGPIPPHVPRHANTLPTSPNYGRPIRTHADNQSIGGGSVNYPENRGLRQNTISEEYQYGPGNPTPYEGAPQQFHPGGGYPQQGWQQDPGYAQASPQGYDSGPSYAQGPPQGYDGYYAAASNVLGMGPPGGGYAASNASHGSNPAMLPASQSTPYLGPPGQQYQPGPSSHYPSSASSIMLSPDGSEIGSRPSLQRSGTTASVTLRTQKSKAIDLSAPPYTKEYIDQYRQRIKADPDPESHFLYAKYLIDAAKKIGADAKDQRSVKKYRDLLITESLKVIRRLATQGEAYDEAQFFLANCYGTGMLGLQVDHERAYHLYLQAAKQNHAAASYRVAVCNEIGAGTRREPPRAAAFYRKAASLGDTAAMYKLGMILLHGSLGEQKNPREAINWLKRAAEQADEENPHALHELGLLHEMPNSQLVLCDPNYAKNLFTQAAQLGYTPSQFKLGQCFEYGTLACPVDPRRSIAWYTKAAEKGYAEAELALSGWYLTGSEGVLKQSDSEAYLWARRAANKGLSKAEYAVGYYAEVGIGIKQDVEFAKRWYMRAAAQGNKRAMNRLTEMKRMGNKRYNVARPTRQDANKDECVIS